MVLRARLTFEALRHTADYALTERMVYGLWLYGPQGYNDDWSTADFALTERMVYRVFRARLTTVARIGNAEGGKATRQQQQTTTFQETDQTKRI